MRSTRNGSRKRGFTIVESSAALVMLIITLGVFVQLVAATSESRMTQRLRAVAGEELRNVFERLGTDDAPDAETRLAGTVANALPDGRLEVERIPCRIDAEHRLAPAADGTVTAIRATVSWDVGANRPRPQLSLVRFAFPTQEPASEPQSEEPEVPLPTPTEENTEDGT